MIFWRNQEIAGGAILIKKIAINPQVFDAKNWFSPKLNQFHKETKQKMCNVTVIHILHLSPYHYTASFETWSETPSTIWDPPFIWQWRVRWTFTKNKFWQNLNPHDVIDIADTIRFLIFRNFVIFCHPITVKVTSLDPKKKRYLTGIFTGKVSPIFWGCQNSREWNLLKFLKLIHLFGHSFCPVHTRARQLKHTSPVFELMLIPL